MIANSHLIHLIFMLDVILKNIAKTMQKLQFLMFNKISKKYLNKIFVQSLFVK